MAQNTFERRERKILFDLSLLPLIEERIAEHMRPDPYNINGEPYQICSIYFDNDNNDVIRHSVSKPFYKEKLRLRSYGTPTLSDNVFFEIKRKMKKIGTKRRASVPLSDVYRFLEDGIIPEGESYINRQVLREIDYFIKTYCARPSAYISYRRNAYFGTDDPDLRLTIDRDVLTRHDELRLELGSFGEPLLPCGKAIMELKFNGAVPLWFASMMSELHLAFGPYSKAGKDFSKKMSK